MTLKDALKHLSIEDYSDRIFNSNSHGELMHLADYFMFAEALKDCQDTAWFREWFVAVVEFAEKHWSRPESVFQHMPRTWTETVPRV